MDERRRVDGQQATTETEKYSAHWSCSASIISIETYRNGLIQRSALLGEALHSLRASRRNLAAAAGALCYVGGAWAKRAAVVSPAPDLRFTLDDVRAAGDPAASAVVDLIDEMDRCIRRLRGIAARKEW